MLRGRHTGLTRLQSDPMSTDVVYCLGLLVGVMGATADVQTEQTELCVKISRVQSLPHHVRPLASVNWFPHTLKLTGVYVTPCIITSHSDWEPMHCHNVSCRRFYAANDVLAWPSF